MVKRTIVYGVVFERYDVKMKTTVYYNKDNTRSIGSIESSDPLYENRDYIKSFLSFIELCESNKESFIYNNLIGEEILYGDNSRVQFTPTDMVDTFHMYIRNVDEVTIRLYYPKDYSTLIEKIEDDLFLKRI